MSRLFGSLHGYRRARGDQVAGLTVWAVLVPQALAYATIAGVSPVGLYAAPARWCRQAVERPRSACSSVSGDSPSTAPTAAPATRTNPAATNHEISAIATPIVP